jgi:lipopolysaccharide-induced tumor necrosis factor-alpha factor
VKETNWILFVILLLLCLPLCWLPFVCMQKEKRKCSACGTTLGAEG